MGKFQRVSAFGNSVQPNATVGRMILQARTEKAIRLLFNADRGLRDARPDDRSVFETLILELTD